MKNVSNCTRWMIALLVAVAVLESDGKPNETGSISGMVVAVQAPLPMAASADSSGCVTVPCTEGGVEWGTVQAGRAYQCRATGTIVINSGGTTRTPDGDGTPAGSDCGTGNPFKRPGLITHALIGEVNGQWIQLGSNKEFIAPSSGSLMLYMNDCYWGDNSGSWQACITPVACNDPVRCGNDTTKSPTCSTDDQPNNIHPKDPVNLGSGATYFEDVELQPVPLPGQLRTAALAFGRFQSSGNVNFPPFQGGWTHNYNVRLQDNTNTIAILDWQGSVRDFVLTNGTYSGDGTSTLSKPDGTNFVWQLTHGTKFTFAATNNSHRLATIADRLGNTVTLSYGTGGELAGADDLGRHLSLLYNGSNQLTQVVDPLGRTNTFTYDAGGRLAGVSDSLGTRAQYLYGNTSFSNAITHLINAGNATNSFTYDASGRALTETNALGQVQSFQWGTNQVTVTMFNGGTYTSCSDSSGALTAHVDFAGTTTYWRDSERRATNVVDRLGGVTQYLYSTNGCGCGTDGNLLRLIDPLGRTNAWSYEPTFSYPLTHTNAAGGVTLWTYDAKGNVTTNTDPAGASTRLGYDAAGNLTAVTDANNHTATFGYDAYGNRTNVADALGHRTAFGYDLIGRLTSRADALGRNESFAWDARDQLTRHVNAAGATNLWGYDGNGNQTAWTNELGFVRQYAHDAIDRLQSMTLPGDAQPFLRYGYDAAGNRTNVTDALGHSTRFGYDPLGRLTAVTNALGQVWSFTVDAEGRRTRATDPNSHTNRFAYDAAGQLTAWTNALNHGTGFGYDKLGNLGTVTDPRGNGMAFSYDAVSRLTSITHAGISTERFGYDPVGNLTGTVNRAGQAIALTYDAANRLTQKSYVGAGDVLTFGYDNANQLTRIGWTNGEVNVSTLGFAYL